MWYITSRFHSVVNQTHFSIFTCTVASPVWKKRITFTVKARLRESDWNIRKARTRRLIRRGSRTARACTVSKAKKVLSETKIVWRQKEHAYRANRPRAMLQWCPLWDFKWWRSHSVERHQSAGILDSWVEKHSFWDKVACLPCPVISRGGKHNGVLMHLKNRRRRDGEGGTWVDG